jgi:hypothetical protein
MLIINLKLHNLIKARLQHFDRLKYKYIPALVKL